MNADVKINATVMSKVRLNSEPFRPTITYNNDFHWKTDLNNYPTILAAAEQALLKLVADEIDKGAESTVHVGIWLDNVTHPPTAAGVVKLPKAHHDFTWTQLELEGNPVGTIADALANVVVNLKNSAKY